MAEMVDVMCGDLFDHIDDLLDFPDDDDVLGMVEPPATAPAFAPLLPSFQDDGLLVGGGGGGEDSPDASADVISAGGGGGGREVDKLGPCDDIDIDLDQLEWLSNFFDNNDSSTLDFPKCTGAGGADDNDNRNNNNNIDNGKDDSLFRTSSPVSVLEPNSLGIGGGGGGGSATSSFSSSSSSSCSGTGGGTSSGARALGASLMLAVPARARSKRPRPATFSARPHVNIPFLPPSSDAILMASSSSDPESFGESNPSPAPMKKKKKKKSFAAIAAGGDEVGSHQPPVRKCMHCEIQKTPQWRAGPMGPKTLCNACGVRYKSGRLFPEYRPAASPTFVPSLHSNSHKKVVEMRIKASERDAAAGMPSSDSAPTDSCDLLAYIRRRE